WTDAIRIETPEQIDISLELAGLGSRFVARLIDWLIKWGILFVVGIVGAVLFGLLGGAASLGDPLAANTPSPFMVLTFLAAFFDAFLLGYDIYFELRQNGQTPGKKRAGIRVIRESGAPVDLRSACVRNFLGVADFLPVFYLLGAFLIALSERKQRLGD